MPARDPQLPDLGGQNVIVTGGEGGLGRGIVRRFVAAGARVLIHYRSSAERAEAFADELRSEGHTVKTAAADLRDPEQCRRLIADAVRLLGSVDVLVNNAGVQPVQPLDETSDDEWRAVIDSNVNATFSTTQAAVAAMREAGTGGAVIHIASVEATFPALNHAHYCASKAAVVMHARTSALEYGRHGIRVNTVSPGLIEREGLAEGWPEGHASWQKNAPLGRLGEAEDIGNACVFLASPNAAFITGHDLVVDGGMSTAPSW
ncbi:MAG: SDR family NAD(P)-dependent oxidoreductase [Leucobacter sp.]